MAVLIQRSQPSYKAGYARNASESANPGLWNGLTGAWPTSLGPTGSTLHNVAGSKDGTLVGIDPSTDWVVDEQGYSLAGDGDSDYVEVDDGSTPTGTALTVSIWVWHIDILTGDQLISKGTFNSDWSWGIRVPGPSPYDKLRLTFNPSVSSAGNDWNRFADILVAKTWTHLAAIFDGSQAANADRTKLWKDGIEQAVDLTNGTMGTSIQNDGGKLNIGRLDGFGSSWKGRIGDTLIYDRVLTPGEIKELYVDPLAPFRRKRRFVFPESAVSATSLGGAFVRTQRSQPSYKQGYARSASESAFPNLWKGIIGAWMTSFGPTGSTVFDLAGNHNDAALTNMSPSTDWVVSENRRLPGYTLDFDGSNDHLLVGGNESDYEGLSGFTACMWIYSPLSGGATDFPVLTSKGGIEIFYLLLIQSTATFSAYINSNLLAGTDGLLVANTWHHVAMTYDGATKSLYVDGVLDVSESQTGALAENASSVTIGDVGGLTRPYIGKIADVIFWNRGLKSNEIQQLYVDSLAPFRRKRRFVFPESAVAGGRVMSSMAHRGGLAGAGGIVGTGGGLAG